MASGTLASLGLGSEVLTSDTLEKLKAADESSRVKPYETKIETNTAKQKALTELTTKLASFQSAVSSLSDSTSFGKRKVTASVTGDSAAATLTASSGVSVQNLSVNVSQIAQKDVYQSKGLGSESDRVLQTGQNPASFTILQNGKEYTIKVEANTTYSDLADKINSATDGNVIAKLVSTGEKNTPYRFTLSSKETGTDNAITFFAGTKDASGIYRESADATAILGNLGWNLKNSIDEADMSGFSFSGGSRVSGVTNLNDQIGQNIQFTLWAGDEKFEIEAYSNESYQMLIDKVAAQTNDKVKITANKTTSGYTFNFAAGDNASSSTKIKIFDGSLDATTNTYKTDSNTSNFLQNTLKIGISKGFSLDDAGGNYQLKKAQDAEFTLDGVKMYRSSNAVSDIGAGITLNLLKAGEINFDIKQDSEGLTSAMEELVESYNELVNYLNEVTAYDSETGTSGDLANVNEIKTLRNSINKILFSSQSIEGKSTDEDGNTVTTNVLVSVLDFGIGFVDTTNSSSRLGLMKFDSATFETKFAADPDFAEKFFASTTDFETINVVGSAAALTSDIDFKNQEFKLIYGGTTYDLSKDADGNDFKLTGTTAEERSQKLLDHINSFGITGLKVSMQELVTSTGKGYALKFTSDEGEDFEISGDKTFLSNFGLNPEKHEAQTITGSGVLAQLKSTLQGFTKTSTVDTEKGTLTLYGERLKTDATNLQEEMEKEQSRIDTYYDTMFNKWVQYDSIIADLKTQQTAINNMIEAANNSKS